MKKYLILAIATLLVVFTGCTQVEPATTDEITEVEKAELVEEIPYDYQGVWLRTALYVDGALQHQTPATLTLNRENYTSTGTCINTGRVISEGEGAMTMTLDSTSCPGVSAGGSVDLTYTITFDEERDIEVMTNVTGPVTETYDRQG